MIDRTGQTWEFSDGLVVMIISTHPLNVASTRYVHSVLVLAQGTDDPELRAGTFDIDWHEADDKTWGNYREDRWRIE